MEDVELRSRQRTQNSFPTTSSDLFIDENKGYVDHKIHANDTLQKIGLFYSVPASEIKRANNIIADQDFYALRYVKVPITNLRLHYLNELHKEQTGHNLVNQDNIAEPRVSTLRTSSEERAQIIDVSDKTPLLNDSDEDEISAPSNAKDRIDKLLGKTDKTVAAVRSQLPASPGLEDGSRFHFVNASAPDNALKVISGTLLLIVGVLLMFVVIPLLLTLMEERNEAELELRHQHLKEQQHSHST
ncbi:unnamed protein product [Bursaphelenchus okinawaensis]|uniref:LysM domain-containing protein n=1 Tax=Bursaphelenchus okinawaensis TaxID=465554 RepID=A0A811JVW0_9BILA|nr:unnamed protein product [Bursaphelenchus okinawaensis]CAG9085607.1 unnamed protein product [Bursaphelenchus okinawaensis]